MPTEQPDFSVFFNEKLKTKGFTLKRLSEVSGIHVKHLENLGAGNFHDLPAAPYVRGYLNIIGGILDFNPGPWWEQVKSAGAVASSGRADELPQNRFVPRAITPKVWLAALGILLLFYLGFRFSKIFGQPVVTVDSPREESSSTHDALLSLRGRAENADQIFVNAEAVQIARDGEWQKDLELSSGLNTIRITAKKFLGRETTVMRQVVYEPVPQATSTPTSTEPAQ